MQSLSVSDIPKRICPEADRIAGSHTCRQSTEYPRQVVAGKFVLRVVEYLRRFARLYDLAHVDEDDVIGDTERLPQRMGSNTAP